MRKERKHYSAEDKIAILRRHLIEGVPISTLCEEHRLQPTQFYQWQKRLFEHGAAAFERSDPAFDRKTERKVARLEEEVRKKNEVLGELMVEHVALKKSLGEI